MFWSNSLISSNSVHNSVLPILPNLEKAKPVYVHGVYYRSERFASQKTKINRRTLRRHLQSEKHKYCYYANEFMEE